MIMKLYEAALSMPIRMRVAPSTSQVMLDTLTYSEDLFAAQAAAGDSFLDLVLKVKYLVTAVLGASIPKLTEKFAQMGFLYHGRPIGEQGVKAFYAIEPYASNREVREAAKALESVTKELNEQTKLQKVCQTCDKYYGNRVPHRPLALAPTFVQRCASLYSIKISQQTST